MSGTILLLCLFAGTASASIMNNFVSFPYAKEPCSCILLTCTCCTGIEVSKVNFSKKLCIILSVKILSLSVDMTIKLDSKQLAQFSFSARNPPTYCIPIVLPINLATCLKIHDVKLVGLTALQMCMTLYSTFNDRDIFVIPFNCVKVSSGSVVHFTTTTTAPNK